MIEPSARTPWYRGPSLMEFLETTEIDEARLQGAPLRLPVQWVNRPNLDFRGFCGLLASGSVKPGDRVRVLPSGRESRVARLVAQGGDLPLAVAGQSVTLTLEDEIDISRGDVIVAADAPAEVAERFEATLVWMADEPMQPGRNVLVKIGTRTLAARFEVPRHKIDVNTLEHHPAQQLGLNEIGLVELTLDAPIAFDPYATNRDTGGFIVIDRLSNNTVGAGMLHKALRRASNIHPQAVDVDQQARARLLGQRPAVLWFTGLSGAGKSTIANLVEKRLHALGRSSYLLDGDNLRHGLNKDLGFSEADRDENIRRVAEVARLMVDAGLIVLTAFISPLRAQRAQAQARFAGGQFIEIHVDTPLAVAEQRDAKGLYRKARRGELPQFTGIDSPYEAPLSPALRLDTSTLSADAAAERVIELLRERGLLDG